MIRQISRIAAGLVLVGLLAGCASGVKRNPDASMPQQEVGQARKFQSVSVALSPEAQNKLVENLKFNQDTLLATIRRALDAKNVIAKSPDQALPKIEVVITDIRVRSTFTAVMFGFMAGSDSIDGIVTVSDATGKELQRFEVSASYALGGLAGGQDESRMNWLYETFAQHVLEEVTGERKS